MSELTNSDVKNKERENNPIRSQTGEMLIGNNAYIVTTHFKNNASETAEDKLLSYVVERMSMEFKGETSINCDLH